MYSEELVRSALEKTRLKDKGIKAVLMVFCDGKTQYSVAKELNITKQAVNQYLFSVKRYLNNQ